MKAIQKELGDEEGKDELAEIEDKLKKTKLSKEAREKATHEFKKLRQMSPMSAESTVVRNYLDWLLSVPWAKRSKIKKDLTGSDHSSLHVDGERVKFKIDVVREHTTHARAASRPWSNSPLSLLKISTGLREAGDFDEPAVPSRSW